MVNTQYSEYELSWDWEGGFFAWLFVFSQLDM